MTGDSPTPAAPERRLVLVVGPYRSGTSLLSSILGQLGFHVPQPEVQADGSNPRGFGEPRWVVDFHQRLLRGRRVTVFDSRPAAWEIMSETASDSAVVRELTSWLTVQYVGADKVVVKDPRIGWFLPLWRRCADDLGLETSFVTLLRYPPEVASSARTWYGTWQNDASRVAAWINVTLHTERATRDARRAFVRYDHLLADWPREIARCARLLDLPWLVGVDGSTHPQVDAFVDPSLRREAVGWDEVRAPRQLQTLADDVWARASSLVEPDGDNEKTRAALDVGRDKYVQLYSDAEAIAQSSVRAVKPRPKPKGAAAPAAGQDGGAKSGTPLPVRMVRKIPRRYRERVPLSLRRRVLNRARAAGRALRR